MDEVDDVDETGQVSKDTPSQEEADRIAEDVSEQATIMNRSLAMMAEAIPYQNEADFSNAIATIDQCVSGLYESLKEVKLAEKVFIILNIIALYSYNFLSASCCTL